MNALLTDTVFQTNTHTSKRCTISFLYKQKYYLHDQNLKTVPFTRQKHFLD